MHASKATLRRKEEQQTPASQALVPAQCSLSPLQMRKNQGEKIHVQAMNASSKPLFRKPAN